MKFTPGSNFTIKLITYWSAQETAEREVQKISTTLNSALAVLNSTQMTKIAILPTGSVWHWHHDVAKQICVKSDAIWSHFRPRADTINAVKWNEVSSFKTSSKANLFSCPGQLNRWPCQSVSEWVRDFWFQRLQQTWNLSGPSGPAVL